MLFKRSHNNQKEITDEELIREFSLNGDLEILGKLYSRYMHFVYGVCLKYLKNRDEASDAVMQIFEKLITDIPKQEILNFRNWLHVVTRNYCLMQLRAEKSKKEKIDEWINDPLVFMENSYAMHPIDEDNPVPGKKLEECIEKLKAEQKLCISLFYFENRSYRDISVSTGLDESKIKSHLQNAKRNLKICLEEKDE